MSNNLKKNERNVQNKITRIFKIVLTRLKKEEDTNEKERWKKLNKIDQKVSFILNIFFYVKTVPSQTITVDE